MYRVPAEGELPCNPCKLTPDFQVQNLYNLGFNLDPRKHNNIESWRNFIIVSLTDYRVVVIVDNIKHHRFFFFTVARNSSHWSVSYHPPSRFSMWRTIPKPWIPQPPLLYLSLPPPFGDCNCNSTVERPHARLSNHGVWSRTSSTVSDYLVKRCRWFTEPPSISVLSIPPCLQMCILIVYPSILLQIRVLRRQYLLSRSGCRQLQHIAAFYSRRQSSSATVSRYNTLYLPCGLLCVSITRAGKGWMGWYGSHNDSFARFGSLLQNGAYSHSLPPVSSRGASSPAISTWWSLAWPRNNQGSEACICMLICSIVSLQAGWIFPFYNRSSAYTVFAYCSALISLRCYTNGENIR